MIFTEPDIERFISKIKLVGCGGCWVWEGTSNKKSYGLFKVGSLNLLAHRVSHELFYGPIPEGMCVLHHCDNPGCVNPGHLFIGTQLDNVADRVSKMRSAFGEKNARSKLNKLEVYEIRRLFNTGKVSESVLAKMFLVNQPCINKIIRGKLWAHLLDSPSM